MFRFVVLCACFAAAAAGLLAPIAPAPLAPLTYSSIVPYSPATYVPTAYSQIGLSTSPLFYQHLIKKRNIEVEHEPTVNEEDLKAGSVLKRSAPILTNYYPTTYAAAPYIPTAYPGPATYYPSTYISAPITYPAHFIKKRSAVIAYAAPAAYSHQYQSSINYSPAIQYSYPAYPAGHIAYAAPIRTL